MARDDLWTGDLLGFDDLARTYTRLITSLHDTSTISIEAGFGRGKTFFREKWAAQMRADGALVIEIDAQTSDHSGDPVVTFLGALLKELPRQDPTAWARNVAVAKRIGLAGAKTVGRALLREGVDEVGDLLAGDEDGARADILKHIKDDTAKGLSKTASDLIDKQLAAEAARDEISENLDELHKALVASHGTDRVIVFIDELDRCHPDYALALLEAMKLVFEHPGFVFVLFVNPDYLETLAAHRFGAQGEGEKYLDKFIDMRLGLPVSDKYLSSAVEHLFSDLPLAIPFGDHEEFSVERAARLAGELAPMSGLSLRQIKAVLFKVRMACICYAEVPIDIALLVFLGFKYAAGKVSLGDGLSEWKLGADLFVRVRADTEAYETAKKELDRFKEGGRLHPAILNDYTIENYVELTELPSDRYRMPSEKEFNETYVWARVLKFLAPHYIPDHEAMLASVHKFAAPGTD